MNTYRTAMTVVGISLIAVVTSSCGGTGEDAEPQARESTTTVTVYRTVTDVTTATETATVTDTVTETVRAEPSPAAAVGADPAGTVAQPYQPPAEPEPVVSAFFYENCTAARAAGAAPVYRGQAGYGPHLDRDNDGIGCE